MASGNFFTRPFPCHLCARSLMDVHDLVIHLQDVHGQDTNTVVNSSSTGPQNNAQIQGVPAPPQRPPFGSNGPQMYAPFQGNYAPAQPPQPVQVSQGSYGLASEPSTRFSIYSQITLPNPPEPTLNSFKSQPVPKNFTCKVCNQNFSTKKELKIHKDQLHRVLCHMCEAVFPTEPDLDDAL